jgi:hypothetical protein
MGVIEKIVEMTMAWCAKRGRVLDITGTAGPEDVYLRRHYLVRSRWVNIFIHQFFRSDRDDLHCHPWDFATYLVRGAYTERKWNPQTGQVDETRRANYLNKIGVFVKLNRLVLRRATDQHQVLTDRPYSLAEARLAPLTVCFTGPARREWGFWREVTTQADGTMPISQRFLPIRTFVPWREYLGLPPDAGGRG